MTGVGVAAGRTALGDLQVELRAVNGRGLQVKCRLPSELQYLEADLERQCRKALQRGTVTMLVSRRGAAESLIDQAAAEASAGALAELVRRLGLEGGVTLRDLLAMPGVVAADQPSARVCPPDVLRLVDAAIDDLVQVRQREGAATEAAMVAEIERMDGLLDQARARAPRLAADYRDKLLLRVEEFLAERGVSLEAKDVVREVAVFADRVDVSEELQRLTEHLKALRSRLAGGGAVGRPLEFLLQEALREANTLGSKSPDVELTHLVVDLKSAIDRLKEQAANLE